MRTLMNKLSLPLLLASMLVSSHAFAQTAAESIQVEGPWVREVPPVSETSAVFMTLSNKGSADASLVKAESDASKLVELHTHETDDKGVHRMFKVEKIDIPANGQTMLKPMSYHIMLIGLKAPVKEGDNVDVKLHFQDGSTVDVTAPVKKMMMPAMDHSKHMMKDEMDHSKHMMKEEMDHSKHMMKEEMDHAKHMMNK